MNKHLIIFLILLFGANIFAQKTQTESVAFEKELRAILCEIENGNYQNVRNSLEKILQIEPRNIFANRLLPGVFSHQIQKKKTSENIAQIRKTIEAYKKATKILQVSAKEMNDVNLHILELYERISPNERLEVLQKMAEDKSLSPEDRSLYYAGLAAKFYSCATDITELEPVKKAVEKDGKWVFVFTKPQNPAEFNKLKTCVAKGMQMIDKAIELEKSSDKEIEDVWSYKTVLLVQKMRIAEMEGNLLEKERLQQEVDAAKKRFNKLAQKRDEKNAQLAKLPSFEFIQLERSDDLTAYKIESSLEKRIPAIYIPTFYVPMEAPPPPIEKEDNPPTKLKDQKKARELSPLDWKLSPFDEELVAYFPVNLKSYDQKEIKIGEAKEGDVKFSILRQPKSVLKNVESDEKALLALAWSMTQSIENSLLNDKRVENFEIKFLKNETVSGQPAKIYSYFSGSCRGKTDGVLIVFVGNKNNYAIDIRGMMKAEDERVEQFIRAISVKK